MIGMDMTLHTVETHEWEIPSYKLGEFQAKIAQANKRLDKAGVDARFEVAYEEFELKKNVARVDQAVVSNHAPVYIYEPWVRATLTGPLTLRHGHFTFVARLIPEEAGTTVHSAPGQELGGYSPRGDNSCDHCRVVRSRSRLYLVRDDRDGSIIQLGHSCIELYTGVSPKGLWSLTFDEELESFTRDDIEGGFGPRHYGAPVDVVLAYAFAHSDKGRAYIPAGMYSETSTVSQVRTSLFTDINRLKEADRDYYITKAAEAAGHLADGELITAIKASVTETAADSDYGRNLRVLLAGESVTGRNVGILGSLVKVYARQQQLEAERKATPVVAGFLGEVKERITDISATAKTVSYREGQWGTKTFLVAIADDGHMLVWSASKALDIESGQRFTIAAATIKAHDNYNGVDQTVITRPSKFTVVGEE
ncbi:hypothetical protein ACORG1_34885 (plasmid) [Mycobacterium sp. TJFP1]